MPLTSDADIAQLLRETRTIALVGASDRPTRPSNGVMRSLQAHGYRVFPVNPQITGEHLHGEYVWRELAQIGEPIDLVDIFRNSADAGAAVDEAIAAGAKAVVDAAWRRRRGRRPARRGGRAQGGDGPLPRDRDPAAGDRANRAGGDVNSAPKSSHPFVPNSH